MATDRSPLRLGAYLGEGLPDEPAIRGFETRTGTRCALVSYYWSWGLGRSPAPLDAARTLLRAGRTPVLTWEPWRLPEAGRDPAHDPEFTLARILDGTLDGYVEWFARRAAALPGTLWLRPMHEMNGNWYPWCGTTNGNRPEQVVLAWRRLHRIFAGCGAANVRWLWCPYTISVPNSAENRVEAYYPGDEFVDLLGVDGYNWGASRTWSRWQAFDELFRPMYATLRRTATKPVIVAEVGCAATGGDKARWLREARASLERHYGAVQGVVWFTVDKECDWRVDSSPDVLDAFRTSWGEPSVRAGAVAVH